MKLIDDLLQWFIGGEPDVVQPPPVPAPEPVDTSRQLDPKYIGWGDIKHFVVCDATRVRARLMGMKYMEEVREVVFDVGIHGGGGQFTRDNFKNGYLSGMQYLQKMKDAWEKEHCEFLFCTAIEPEFDTDCGIWGPTIHITAKFEVIKLRIKEIESTPMHQDP